MAEVAGLVIGGISMAALVDGCMRTFDRIESARTYGRDYQRAALRLGLLQLRLSRWRESVITAMYQHNVRTIGTSQDAGTVQDLLGDIIDDIERTEKFAERYNVADIAPGPSKENNELAAMESLSKRVQTLALHRQKSSTFGQKTRWALRDQRKFKKLLDSLSDSISSLETIFPAERLPGIVETQKQLALTEATKLIEPSEIEEPDDDATLVAFVLEDAACDVDGTLKDAVKNASQKTRTGRHVFGDTNFSDGARVQLGDYVAPGQRATGIGHTYGTMTAAGGSTRVHYGDNYGGRSVFDD